MSRRRGISLGCNACRKHRVKCDESRPVCARCLRNCRECDYRDSFDLVHRDQSRAAELRTQRTWRSRAGTVVEPIDKGRTSLRQQPSHDLYTLAFCRFCYDFLDPPNHAFSRPGTFAIIPPLCFSLPSSSALVTAVKAVSLANYAARMHAPNALSESRKHYVKSLTALRQAIGHTTTMRKAETVLSSYMLWLYEVVSKPESDSVATTHLLGSENIMKLMTGSSSKSLVAFAQTEFGSLSVSYAFLRHLGYYEPPTQWLDQLVRSLGTENLRHRLWRICHKCVCSCARIKRLEYRARSQGCFDIDERLASMESVRMIGTELQAWERDMKKFYPFRVFEIQANHRKVAWIRGLFNHDGAPHKMHVFQDSHSFFDWKLYWTSRLNLYLCLLDLVEVTSTSGLGLVNFEVARLGTNVLESQIRIAVDNIIEVASSMLAAIPCVLGIQPPTIATVTGSFFRPPGDLSPVPDPARVSDIGSLRGYHLYWPLFTLWRACHRRTIHDSGMAENVVWITTFMQFLWQELGIAQSESCVRWYRGGLMQTLMVAY